MKVRTDSVLGEMFALPTMTAAGALGALLFLVGARSGGPISGPDSLWHLVLGHSLRHSWNFGPEDPLSAFSTQPWVYNQWLPEVAASLAEDAGGLPAVAWIVVAARVALVVALWALCRRQTGPLPALVAACVASFGTVMAWDARPQLIGVLLFVAAASAALSTADDGRPRWWMIPLTWLWACTHGTWILGIAALLVVALAGLADRPRDALRLHLMRFAVPAGCAVAAAVTPTGPRLYTTVTAIGDVTDFIVEWRPASLTNPIMAVTVAAIGFVLLSWVRGWQPRPNWGRVAVLAFAAGNAMLYTRTVALAAVLVAPLLAEALQALLPRRPGSLRVEAVAVAIGVLAGLGVAAGTLPTIARTPGDSPTALTPLLARQQGVVFNDLGQGGWLYWAHPQLAPVFDTRWEVFGRQASEAYRATLEARPGWQEHFDATGAHSALLDREAPLVEALQSRGWLAQGADSGYVLLTRPQ